MWPRTGDVDATALATPVAAAKAFLTAVGGGTRPVLVKLVEPPRHGRAVVAYGTRPGGTITLRRVGRVWFVTGASSPVITVGPATLTGPRSVTVKLAPVAGELAVGSATLIDASGTIVDEIVVAPGFMHTASTTILIHGNGAAPELARPPGRSPVRLAGMPRSAEVPCLCELHAGPGAAPAVVQVVLPNDLHRSGLSVAAVPVSPR